MDTLTPRPRRVLIELLPKVEQETGRLTVTFNQAPEAVPTDLQKLGVDAQDWGRLMDEVTGVAASNPGPYTEAEAEKLAYTPRQGGGCFACLSGGGSDADPPEYRLHPARPGGADAAAWLEKADAIVGRWADPFFASRGCTLTLQARGGTRACFQVQLPATSTWSRSTLATEPSGELQQQQQQQQQ